jgi:hypothetical protein
VVPCSLEIKVSFLLRDPYKYIVCKRHVKLLSATAYNIKLVTFILTSSAWLLRAAKMSINSKKSPVCLRRPLALDSYRVIKFWTIYGEHDGVVCGFQGDDVDFVGLEVVDDLGDEGQQNVEELFVAPLLLV